AVLPDPHAGADDPHGLLSVHHLLAISAPVFHDFLVGVTEKSERNLEFATEFLVGLAAVGRDAEQDRARLLQILPQVAEAAGFLRSAGRVVLGIEVDEDILALERREGDGIAVLVGKREVGSFLAFFDLAHGVSKNSPQSYLMPSV